MQYVGDNFMVNRDDLTINQKAVLIALSSLNEKGLHNRIYFEKFLFLLSKSLPDLLEDLADTFDAYKMGPYNEYADEIIDGLKNYNLMSSSTELSEEGKKLAEELKGDKEILPVIKKTNELDETLKGFNVDDILFLVYNLYPDYTTQSQISNNVKSHKLEAFKFNINNIDNGNIATVTSDKGHKIKVRRIGDELVIMED